MGTKHIHNPGPNVMFVGSKMIPPGEGRDIDESLLPPEHRDAPVAAEKQPPSLDALLLEELKKPAKELIDALPGLTQEAIERMDALESEAKKPRKTLLEAIAADLLRRSNEAMQGGSDNDTAAGGQQD